jgi:hypothetical protein
MRRIPMRRTVIVGATAGAVLLTGGVAFAYWSSTGTNVAAAEVATEASSLSVEQASSVTGLFPGGTPQNISVKVDNTSGTDILLTDVSVTLTDVVEAVTATGACSPLDFELLDVAHTPEVLDATDGTTTFVAATIRLLETGVNQDDCKNADLVLTLVAS